MSSVPARRAAAAFRDWLIERLLASIHVREPARSDAEIRVRAMALGIQPDLLTEARVRFVEQSKALGVQPPLGRKKAKSEHYQIKCVMPKTLFERWIVHCEERGVQGSALLRSLIHGYLLGSQEPSQLTIYWVWQGRRLSAPERGWERGKVGGAYPYRERALITQGARRALARRAAAIGCSYSAVVRGLVTDTLLGKHPNVRLVDARTMYDDENRYLSG